MNKSLENRLKLIAGDSNVRCDVHLEPEELQNTM